MHIGSDIFPRERQNKSRLFEQEKQGMQEIRISVARTKFLLRMVGISVHAAQSLKQHFSQSTTSIMTALKCVGRNFIPATELGFTNG